MELLSKNECQLKAQAVFDYKKEVEQVLVVADGTAFNSENKNAAEDYANRAAGIGKPALKIYSFERGESVEEEEESETNDGWSDLTIEEIKLRVATIDNVEVLEVGKELVSSKGGKAAIDERISELSENK